MFSTLCLVYFHTALFENVILLLAVQKGKQYLSPLICASKSMGNKEFFMPVFVYANTPLVKLNLEIGNNKKIKTTNNRKSYNTTC